VTSSGGGGGGPGSAPGSKSSTASAASSRAHPSSFLSAHRQARRAKGANLLARLSAVADVLPSDEVEAPVALGQSSAAAAAPARPEWMERTASQMQDLEPVDEEAPVPVSAAGDAVAQAEPSKPVRAPSHVQGTLSPFPLSRAVSVEAVGGDASSVPTKESDAAEAMDVDDGAAAVSAPAVHASDPSLSVRQVSDLLSSSAPSGFTVSQPTAGNVKSRQEAAASSPVPLSEPIPSSSSRQPSASPPPVAAPAAASGAAPMAASTSAASSAAAAPAVDRRQSSDFASSLSLPMGSSISQAQAQVVQAPIMPGDETQDDEKSEPSIAPAAVSRAVSEAEAEQPVIAPARAVRLAPAAPLEALQVLSEPMFHSPPAAFVADRPSSQPQLGSAVGVVPVGAASLPDAAAAHEALLQARTQSFSPPTTLLPSSPPAGISSVAAATTPAAAVVIEESPAIDAPVFPSAADIAAEVKPAAPVVAPASPAKAAAQQQEDDRPAAPAAAPPSASSAAPSASPSRHAGSKRPLEREESVDEAAAAAASVAPSPSLRASSPVAKRVQFNERRNVAVSPSPRFSASYASNSSLGSTAAEEQQDTPSSGSSFSSGSEDQPDALMLDGEEKAPSAPVDRRLILTPASQLERPPVVSRAEREQQRAEVLAAHEVKKAQQKLLANPPGSVSAVNSGGGPVPILKRSAAVAPTVAAAAAGEEQPRAPGIYPSLAFSLAPLSHLLSCLPAAPSGGAASSAPSSSSALSTAFSGLFAVLSLTTVGEVASTSKAVLRQAALGMYEIQEAVAPMVNDQEFAPDAALRVLGEALAMHESKQLKPDRKRKQPAPAQPSAPAAGFAAAADEKPSEATVASSVPSEMSAFKRAKLDHGASAPTAAADGSQTRTDASPSSAPLLGASATAFASMPVPSGIIRQLSAVRTLSQAELNAPPDQVGRCDGMAYALFLPAKSDAPPLGGVMVLPGAGSKKESHFAFANACRAAGLAALVPDLRGHGASEGQLDGRVLDDLAALAALLPRGVPLILRGSSMGGYLSLVSAARLRAAAVVAICPAPAEGMRVGIAERAFLFRGDAAALNAFLIKNDDLLAAQALACPVLLLHAEGDRSVPVSHSRALMARIKSPGSRLLTCPGGSHNSIQQNRDMDAAQVRWIREVLLDQAQAAAAAAQAAPSALAPPARESSTSQLSQPSGGAGATGSQVQASNSSPMMPFVAPEFAAPSVPRPLPQVVATPQAEAVDVEAEPAFVAPIKPVPVASFSAAAAVAAPAASDAAALVPVAPPQISAPSPVAISSSSPAVAAPAVILPALIPAAVSVAHAADPVAEQQPPVLLHISSSMQVDEDALVEELQQDVLSEEGPVAEQVHLLRARIQDSMAAMFATAESLQPAAAGAAADPSAIPARPVNVLSQLNAMQLREMQSYLQSMLAATSAQLRRRERERSGVSRRNSSNAFPSLNTTPRRNSVSSPPAPTR